MIRIHGFNKLTLLDYPGKVACTLFLGHCNFRCPYCHNGNLVLHPEQEPVIPMEEILGTLKKRSGILDGVCISGGEPTLNPRLPWLMEKIRTMGYAVKLDTNGSNPELVEQLVSQELVDYVAVDIKNSPRKYAETAGVKLDVTKINDTVEFLKKDTVDYEFRTTIVRELHKKEDMLEIGKWLAGSRRYFLQAYRESDQMIGSGFSGYSREQLENFRELLLSQISEVGIRGI